jgi:hypothetical protein
MLHELFKLEEVCQIEPVRTSGTSISCFWFISRMALTTKLNGLDSGKWQLALLGNDGIPLCVLGPIAAKRFRKESPCIQHQLLAAQVLLTNLLNELAAHRRVSSGRLLQGLEGILLSQRHLNSTWSSSVLSAN